MALGKRASVLGPILDAHTDRVEAGGIVSSMTVSEIIDAISRTDHASRAGDNVVRAVDGTATVSQVRTGLGENIPTVASIINQAQLIARGSNRAFIAGQVFGAAVDLIGFNGGEILLGYDAGDGPSDTIVEGALTVKGAANMRSLRVDGVTSGHIKTGTIYADAITSAGLQAEQSLTLGTGNSFNYGTLRFDPDALWIDTSSPFVASLKPMVIHKGDYAGTNYLVVQPVTDAGKEYWQIASTHNLSFGAAVNNLMVFFGTAGASTWLDLSGSANDGPVWKSSNYAHWWSNLGKTLFWGLDLSSTSRAVLTTTSNKMRFSGSTGAWIEANLTGSAADGPRLDSSGYKFTLYDSGGTRNFQLDMSNSAGAALKAWTNKIYLTGAAGAVLTFDLTGSAADGPRLDSSGEKFTLYNSGGTRNLQLDLASSTALALYTTSNRFQFIKSGGASLKIDLTGTAADGPRFDSSGYDFTFYDSAGARSLQFDMSDSAGAAVNTWTGRLYLNGDGGRSLVYFGDGAYSENKLVLTDYSGSGRLWSVDTTHASFSTITSHGGFKHVVGSDYMTFSPNAAGVQFDLNASSRIFFFNGILNCGEEYRIDNTKVVGNRVTGWTAWTGTAQRGTKNADAVGLTDVARALKALIDDLISHGLIGA